MSWFVGSSRLASIRYPRSSALSLKDGFDFLTKYWYIIKLFGRLAQLVQSVPSRITGREGHWFDPVLPEKSLLKPKGRLAQLVQSVPSRITGREGHWFDPVLPEKSLLKPKGRLAQLVQSVRLTRVRSLVRSQ